MQPEADITKVMLTPDATEAVKVTAERHNDTYLNTVNRALVVYRNVTDLAPGEKLTFGITNGGKRITVQRIDAFLVADRVVIFGLFLVTAFAAGLVAR